MYCGKCGFNDNGEGNFCKNCGASLRTPAVKKKELSVAFKRAWFAPVAVVATFVITFVVGFIISNIFGSNHDYLMDMFMKELGLDFMKSFDAIGAFHNIINDLFTNLLSLPCCFLVYLIAFKTVDKKLRAKISMIFLVPYVCQTFLNLVVSKTFTNIAFISYGYLKTIDVSVYTGINSFVVICTTLVAAIISFFISWNYLRRFENELKK